MPRGTVLTLLVLAAMSLFITLAALSRYARQDRWGVPTILGVLTLLLLLVAAYAAFGGH